MSAKLGRTPDSIKELCRNKVLNDKLIDILGGIAASAESSNKDRIHAIEVLLDRGFGKPTQSVELSGDVSLNLIEAVRQARKARGL